MLTIVTALLCEARPLIDHYRLKKQNDNRNYQIYTNENIGLIISGVGRVASASATAYAHALNGSTQFSSWLNVGIAGHSNQELGSSFIANKIHETTTQKNFYPSLVLEPPCLTDILNTVDQPDHKYRLLGGVDMEAAAFYATANRFTTSELIQVYKVVSDNPKQPVKKFSAENVSTLINEKRDEITLVIDQLISLMCELKAAEFVIPDYYFQIVSDLRLSHSESQQFQRQLKRLSLINHTNTFCSNLSSELIEQKTKLRLFTKLDQLIADQAVHF